MINRFLCTTYFNHLDNTKIINKMGEHLKSAGHDYIRYANCWEDADILMQALDPKPDGRLV